ncbi:polysaccharide biosynthesis C-terminal domain-containing protein [Sulfitobacter sp. HGT1]|uniref:oligosaccharide flippase family protein n=1 Tax=Sulfitobacter sp. HGT1 TaxID=2735435 RepID=UPI0015938C5A|nr:polysaccharide biosynthesis C-terminal domain-containing protein [Sulfitobacter sp. HGT1]
MGTVTAHRDPDGANGGSFRHEILRGGAGSIAVRTISASVGFAVAVVLSRWLGVGGFGSYSFALAILSIVAIPVQVGLPQLVVRETAKAHALGDWAMIRGLWGWANRRVLMFSGLALVGVTAAIFSLGLEGRGEVILIGIGLIPVIALSNLRSASLRGLRNVVVGQLPETVVRPLAMLVLIGSAILVFPASTIDARVAMLCFFTASVVSLSVGAAMLHAVRPLELRAATDLRTEPEAWRRAVMPLALITGLQLVNNQADIIILGLFHNDEEVGIYRACFQLALLVIFGLQSITQVLQPHFARLYALGEIDRLQRLVTLASRSVTALAVVPIVVLVLWPSSLLRTTFGIEFESGGQVLIILALAQLVNASFGSVGMLLNMTGHERDTLKGLAVAAALNIILNFVAVPLYGGIGAAAATALSMTVWNILLWHSVWKRLGLDASALGLRKRK